jgi:hypothetical protein
VANESLIQSSFNIRPSEMTQASRDWVVCDGGPHLLLPTELVPFWEGVNEPFGGRVVHARFRASCDKSAPATDYDLACDVEGYLGIIPVGNGFGLVIGDVVPMSTWIPSGPIRGGFVAVPEYWDIELASFFPRINAAVNELFEDDFAPTGFSLTTRTDGFTLLAACDNGPKWVYSTVSIPLEANTYEVSATRCVAPDFEARVYRLCPASEKRA